MTNTQTPPTVVNTTGAPVTNAVANHSERPKKFNGRNFKRWQQKMFFYLTTLGLARFLKETTPQVEPPAEDIQKNTVRNQGMLLSLNSYFLFIQRNWKARQISMMKLSKIRDNEYDMISKREDKIQRERKMRMKKLNQRRSIRARNKKCLDDFVSFMVENELVTVLPRSGTSSEGHNWRKAIKSEIDSILNNHTWELVDLPPGYKPLGYKWISRREKA
ncbi:hypothetical protein Tco_1090919 [Tanacetum coccineum]|uniref:Uncharacterized protein n=1 Tax=Tanacetum coccineum TaxID=301880 RepID=A0ABQ5I5K5_9ASTR